MAYVYVALQAVDFSGSGAKAVIDSKSREKDPTYACTHTSLWVLGLSLGEYLSVETMSEYICGKCGLEFGNKRGLSMHKTQSHDKPWHEKENLEELYHEEELSIQEMADKWGTTYPTVWRGLDNFGIERRDPTKIAQQAKKKMPASFGTNLDGYEVWDTSYYDERYHMSVHRLLAISEFGIDAVKDKVVHHENGLKWDNRPENLELMDLAEHTRMHLTGEGCGTSKLTREDVRQIKCLLRDTDKPQYKIADIFDVSNCTISEIKNQNRWGHVEIDGWP